MEQSGKQEERIFKNIKTGTYRNCYLVYIRKSTDEPNNQKNSIAYQKAEAAKFIQREQLSVAPISVTGFCVDGIISERHSGFKENNDLTFTREGLVQYQIDRPKFQKLVQFLSLGLFKGIVCLCWDRMSRNKGDDTIIRKLMRKGIDFRFVYANYEKTSAGALHMDIDGMFAEHHSRVTSEKVRLTTWNLRERGVVTYKAPVGYLNQGSMDHKPFDPERAPIIKILFEKYATGQWSLADLVRLANKQGLTATPSRRRRTQDEMLAEEDEEIEIEKVARPMTNTSIQKILTNPFYTGRMLGNDDVYIKSVSHEALITDKLFDRVQTMLKTRKVSLHYTDKIELPFRGLVRCGDCRRVYTPYLQKGIQYFGARCPTSCTNARKSFNISFIEKEVGKFINGLSYTDQELVQLDAETSTHISLFEEKRLQAIELNDRRKKKIREDLAYLRSNKLQMLRNGVYSVETMKDEETRLNKELADIQEQEVISDLSMQAVMEDVEKLSELLKTGSKYYSFAKSPEKEAIIRIIFSELFVSGNTLQYKAKNGFEVLQNRFSVACDQRTWLSEVVRNYKWVKESIRSLTDFLSASPSMGP